MPIGVCTRCQRAFILDGDSRAAITTCPRCGTSLTITSVREAKDLPELPLQLPDTHHERPDEDCGLAAPRQ